MGASQAKDANVQKREVAAAAAPSGSPLVNGNSPKPSAPSTDAAAQPAASRRDFDIKEYEKFREELFAFSLGEASFDYAERMYQKQPNNPQVMALLAETALLYERIKNPTKRDHWIDRQDLLVRGIDVARKCMKEHPDYAPCAANYVMLAVKAAEGQYYWKWLQPFGLMSYYNIIEEQAEKAISLGANSSMLHRALGELNGRAAPGSWYSIYHLPQWYYGLPSRRQMLERSRDHHLKAYDINPKDLENACRLGMTYFQLGEFNEARRWYVRVRDEMIPTEPKDDVWQGVAHTSLCTHFDKTKWNTPFG